MRFLRDMKNALWANLPLRRGPVGELGGDSFAETFKKIKRKVYPDSIFWIRML